MSSEISVIVAETLNSGLREIDEVSTGLADLAKKYESTVYPVNTTEGMDQAKKARAEIREVRYDIERKRKEIKSKLAQAGKQIEARAGEITLALMKLEVPIDQQIKAEEARKEAERQAKIEAERQRQQAIRAQLDAIMQMPASTPRTIEALSAAIETLDSMTPTEAVFQEFLEQAISLREKALETLRKAHSEEVAAEERRAQFERERAELEEERKRLSAEREEEERRAAARAEQERIDAMRAEEVRKQREAQEYLAHCNAKISDVRLLARGASKRPLEHLRANLKIVRETELTEENFGPVLGDARDAVADAIEVLEQAISAKESAAVNAPSKPDGSHEAVVQGAGSGGISKVEPPAPPPADDNSSAVSSAAARINEAIAFRDRVNGIGISLPSEIVKIIGDLRNWLFRTHILKLATSEEDDGEIMLALIRAGLDTEDFRK